MAGVTLRTLAKRSGSSPATVSRALSGHPHVKASVRARIEAVAREMGYARSALVASVLSQVRSARTPHFRGTLAIVHVPAPGQQALLGPQRRAIEGATQRAAALGFTLEKVRVDAKSLPAPMLGRMLAARGVAGVVVMGTHGTELLAGFPWERFAAVTFDYGMTGARQHTATIDHHWTLTEALLRLRNLGYRRIGLVLERAKDVRIVYKWSATFRSFQHQQGGIGRVPVLFLPRLEPAQFHAWRGRHQPDLYIGHCDAVIDWLAAKRIRVPEDAGFFSLNHDERTRPCAGLDLRPKMLGAVAVDTLFAQIVRNERGLPETPQVVMFAGHWVDGPTLRTTST